jgi:hypothetical protein
MNERPTLDEIDAELERIERGLRDDAELHADPALGVWCHLRCTDRPCEHTRYIVEALREGR